MATTTNADVETQTIDGVRDLHVPTAIVDLHDALHSERRLLRDLGEVLRQQRNAVAANDVAAVDDSTYALHRVLLTLGEARRRRHRLLEILQLPDSVSLRELVPALGQRVTAELSDESRELQQCAAEIAREVAINRVLLRGALAAGESLIVAIASPAAKEQTFSALDDSRLSGGMLLNARM